MIFNSSILTISYLVGSVAFIQGLKMLSSPKTALIGNRISAAGMLVAIVGTLIFYRNSSGEGISNLSWIFSAMTVGTVVGVLAAKKVKMTAIPQLVSVFNGAGGLCAASIGIVEFNHLQVNGELNSASIGYLVILLAGFVIGSISFGGSTIVFSKLNGNIKKTFSFPGQQIVNFLLLATIITFAALLMINREDASIYFYILLSLAILYGILFVLPIGGADMPVVMSLLNSFTGIATAFGGFLYSNTAMMTGGILVGSSGMILTLTMCHAMNRSLPSVVFGAFKAKKATNAGKMSEGTYREVSISDTAQILNYAHKVMIVPGYGLAVAQAQNACHDLEKLLSDKGIDVSYAIHPVAGRMPGQMNVLLAEANVPYEKLLEMGQSNAAFPDTDVVLILGANDVVNPAAEKDPSSPIYGMQILEVDKAKQVIVNKRTMHPGYAGISNALFYEPNTSMLFGDAKGVLEKLIAEIKAL
ncbi:NAD(P)(+) transhydrogenase (Re/Si-specific) subunit beta [Putridiphycobacter roseus]|uniref:NAD(P) transhydrogenase subunit beta n=1 Tax=Putridiphycobacter roseus TaxID=2219161 RepID=A0A2W1N3F6_9FLAO|nr:NAD(P)(+) transhydrogenase (Re/Si-specific) subunit beta [Putridiphycobacter roseus]PZE17561.1 NAD(P)(+) transhydrogenase (Re/Si-specific) subunit beta [Putridiphycobacter roseus]